MNRLLHFALLIFAFVLYGIGVNIISGVLADPPRDSSSLLRTYRPSR
jgi:hypothetical protein